jgi:DNA segregation ATPase FtsK/SpoIIIE-like protein
MPSSPGPILCIQRGVKGRNYKVKATGVALIDSIGAERLLGADDMLFIAPGSAKLRRLHGSFVSETKIRRICDFLTWPCPISRCGLSRPLKFARRTIHATRGLGPALR